MNIKKYVVMVSLFVIAFAAALYLQLTNTCSIAASLLSGLSFAYVFTVFDTIGWGEAIHQQHRYNDKTIVIPYRFMQNIFMYFGYICLWLIFGWKSAATAATIWWFGGCDLLYYFFLPYPLMDTVDGKKYEYDWMKNWSVHLLLKLLIPGYFCSRCMFITWACLSIIPIGVINVLLR